MEIRDRLRIREDGFSLSDLVLSTGRASIIERRSTLVKGVLETPSNSLPRPMKHEAFPEKEVVQPK